jgi:hypothetical protein
MHSAVGGLARCVRPVYSVQDLGGGSSAVGFVNVCVYRLWPMGGEQQDRARGHLGAGVDLGRWKYLTECD